MNPLERPFAALLRWLALAARGGKRIRRLLPDNQNSEVDFAKALDKALPNLTWIKDIQADNNLAAVIWRTDPLGNAIGENLSWRQFTGQSLDEIRGKGWSLSIHPDDQAHVLTTESAATAKEPFWQVEYRLRRFDGAWRHMEMRGVPVLKPDGLITEWIYFCIDITERKQLERASNAISTDLVRLSGPAYYEAALRQIVVLLDMELAFIGRVNPDTIDTLRTIVMLEGDIITSNIAFATPGTPCADVVAGRPGVITDGVQSRYPASSLFREKLIESYVGEPVNDSRGQPVGCVVALGRKPLRNPEHAATILRMFGVAVTVEMTREHARQQHEDIFAFAPDAIISVDRAGIVVSANHATERMFGYSSAELIGAPVETLIPTAHRKSHVGQRQEFFARGIARTMAANNAILEAVSKDGTIFPVSISIAPVETVDGKIVVAIVRNMTAQVTAQRESEAAKATLADAISSIDHGVALYDAEGRLVLFNEHFRSQAYKLEDCIKVGAHVGDITRAALERGLIVIPPGWTADDVIKERLAAHWDPTPKHLIQHLKDGRIIQITERRASNGGVITLRLDVTELYRTQSQLREAQKMDAIGKLTGGMAHDFNNYLGIIIANLDLLWRRNRDHAMTSLIDSALRGAMSAAELTQSLLAFARRQMLSPSIMQMNRPVAAISEMLKQTLGENITIVVILSPDLWAVLIDRAQLESCIVNLATNARDAMPAGGSLTISTRNVTLDSMPHVSDEAETGGDYVLLEITDSGVGMSPEVVARVFEPFFTTKPVGQGTGLGLSSVYGFVKQSGGHMRIHSKVGDGTVVRIFLPRAGEAPTTQPNALAADALPVGTETILIVDDKAALRESLKAQLEFLGYRVIEAASGEAALDILSSPQSRVDILFTDIIMPGKLDGFELAKRAQAMRPDIKVLGTSGFPGDRYGQKGAQSTEMVLLAKPYRLAQLARAIRAALDSEPAPPSEGPTRSG